MFGGFINPPLGGGDRGGFKGAQPPSAPLVKKGYIGYAIVDNSNFIL